ncbi:MAG: sulfatase-like hydrolase/transferase [Oscillospiraceae bacterium]|nr:sulfatase-like hydrolase/transferase [Oscillospiraceae bacterium]
MEKTNILWIQADELRVDALGCYGGDNLTPNIDALAARGAVFRRHFTTSPVCVPARVSELTGCYPCRTGVLENSVHYTHGRWPQDLRAFPEFFLEQGWATANFGKYHTPSHGSWGENWHMEHLNEVGHFMALHPPYDEQEHEVLHLGRSERNVIVAGRYPDVAQVSPTHRVTDHALEWLSAYQHVRRPFLLRVSYLAPHTPVLAPEPFYSMYKDKNYTWDRPAQQTLEDRPDLEKNGREIFGGQSYYAAHTEEDFQRMRRTYCALVSHIDDEVGRLVEHLKQTGEYENTVILFTSDHGDLMGEYGQFQKGVFYDITANVPCILAGPGVKPGVYDNLTECVDIAPTLMALCGLQPEQQFQGEDMFASDKPEVLGEIFLSGRRRSWLRTKQYSLDITTAENGEHTAPDRYDGKLIDLAADPLYHTNVYGSPAYAEIQQQLTGRLLARIAPYPIEVKRGDIPM